MFRPSCALEAAQQHLVGHPLRARPTAVQHIVTGAAPEARALVRSLQAHALAVSQLVRMAQYRRCRVCVTHARDTQRAVLAARRAPDRRHARPLRLHRLLPRLPRRAHRAVQRVLHGHGGGLRFSLEHAGATLHWRLRTQWRAAPQLSGSLHAGSTVTTALFLKTTTQSARLCFPFFANLMAATVGAFRIALEAAAKSTPSTRSQ